MNSYLMDDEDMVDFDAEISDIDDTAEFLKSDEAKRLDARRRIEQLLEMKALKELDEDIEWWDPE